MREWIEAPVCYTEWFENIYPECRYLNISNRKYVLQTINRMQGRKDTGHSWYLLLQSILDLEDFGFVPCSVELALFTFYTGPESMIVVSSMDDF